MQFPDRSRAVSHSLGAGLVVFWAEEAAARTE